MLSIAFTPQGLSPFEACHPPAWRIGGTPTVGVKAIHAGFDWDSNTILIYPEEQLTRLTPDEVAAITKSVSKGQSWHSYQQFKKYREQLAEATEEINRLRAELGRYQNNGRGNAKTRNYQSRC